MKKSAYTLKVTGENEIQKLKELSTEKLIVWIIGRCLELDIQLSPEEISLECWLINPEKHSLRGYPQYPDSFVVIKRLYDMKGRKGLLKGSAHDGFQLTPLSKRLFSDIVASMRFQLGKGSNSKHGANRSLSARDESPYIRLRNTPAYRKMKEGRLEEIVETDFLYFYGINWHSKTTQVESRLRNVDLVVKMFGSDDAILKELREFLNKKYDHIKTRLLRKTQSDE